MSDSEEKFIVEEAPEGAVPPAPSQDEELEKYSAGVQARINAEVAKSNRLARELEEAKAFGSRAAEIAKRAATEVQELRGRTASSEAGMVENLVSSLDSELTVAKSELRAAYEAQDADKIAEATAKVSGVAADLRRAQVAKVAHQQEREEAARESARKAEERKNAPPPPPRQTPPPLAPKAKAWIDKNSEWFGKDQEKTKTAAAASDYVAKALGLSPNDDAHYEEVDKMIAARHGSTANEGQARDQRPSGQSVAPMGRSTPAAPGARKVTLTASEAATARRMGVSLEDYAKAKSAGGIV